MSDALTENVAAGSALARKLLAVSHLDGHNDIVIGLAALDMLIGCTKNNPPMRSLVEMFWKTWTDAQDEGAAIALDALTVPHV